MFDNPNDELNKLEQQLLAAEEPAAEDFEAFYQDLLKEFGPASQTSSTRKTTSSKKPPQKPAPAGQKKSSGKKSSGKKKKKSVTGLVITLCLECAGIIGIILWWLLRIL